MIYFTSAYYKIKKLTKKIKVIQGGQGASKTYSICLLLLEKALEKKRTITIMTDTYDNLKDGAIADFQNIFEATEGVLEWDKCYNKSSHDLQIHNSVIQFRYISDNKKQAGKSKRRDILYINEANKVGWEVAVTYIGRTHEEVYLDFNPDFEFWAHTEIPKMLDDQGNQMSEQIVLTYLDNEMLPEAERLFIESRKENESWYRVYGLGLTGFYSERRIFDFKTIANVPNNARRIASGMDFGVSPDPTCLIDCYIQDNNLILNQRFSCNNLLPEKLRGTDRMSIVDKLEEVKHLKGRLIIADSAGATEIRDMRKHGYNVEGVHKFAGSQLQGINKMRGYNILITESSNELIKGFESWFWKVDANGKIIPEPDGHEPDGIAAVRYVILEHGKN